MPREYKVKISVDSTAAEGKIAQFEQKVTRTFDKLNKTSFKPTAFINGINLSINKVMELAAKEEAAAAKRAASEAKVAQAKEKTAQEEAKATAKMVQAEEKRRQEEEKTLQLREKSAQEYQKTAQTEIAASAKVRSEEEKTAQSRQKTAQVQIAAAAKVIESQNKIAAETVKAHGQITASANKMSGDYAKAEASMVNAREKTVQNELNSANKITQMRVQASLKTQQADKQAEHTHTQTTNTIVNNNVKVENSFNRLGTSVMTAWNNIKMVIGFAGVAGMFRSAFNEMKAMSDELVTYQKVTNATAEQMQKVRAQSYEAGRAYGQTPSDFLASSAIMARAGYGEQAGEMAKLATMTQLVGDMSAEAASKFLISVDAGYRLGGSIEKLTEVINAANVADNNYATSLSEIAQGMTLVAPLAASMNISVEETTAAIGTMQALTQRSGTEVARAFRMIAINIAKDTETEVEEGFKLTEENIRDFNALLQEFAKEELEAAEASGKLLSPMKAIEAIAKAWRTGKLNEQDLFSVLNKIGGARWTNSIMALVKNFEVYEDMLQRFSTDTESAEKEVEAMLGGWTAKLNILKTAWTELVNDRVSEDFIKRLIDMGTAFIEWTGNLENFITVGAGAIVVIKQMLTLLSGGVAAINPVVLILGALATAIGVAAAASDNYQKKIREESQAAADSAKQAKEKAQSINELVAAYNALASDGTIDDTELEEARRIQEEINNLVDDLPEKYDLVTGSIEKNKKALAEMNEEQRKASLRAAKVAKADAGRALEKGLSWNKDLDVATPANWLWQNGGYENALKGWLEGTSYEYHPWSGNALTYTGGKDAESIVKALEELDEISAQMVQYAEENGLQLPGLYDGIQKVRENFDELRRNYEYTVQTVKDIEEENFAPSGTGGTSGTDSGKKAAEEGTKANDAYAESYNRLTDAIRKARDAQEDFKTATSGTKGDELKFYGSVLEAYKGELKAGRVNSRLFHEAARAMLGEEAYQSTGGYTQNIQAMMNGKGSAGISLIDAITTLTAEYKNQAGEVREGAGLAVLLEKLGYKVKDEKGNYSVHMTEEIYEAVMKAIPGLSRELLANAANAYDQYDIKGRNTDIAPEIEKELTSEEQNTQANQENTTATENNTGAVEASTSATEAQTAAIEQNTAAVGEATAALQGKDDSGSGRNTAEDLEALQYRQDKQWEDDKALAKYAAEEKAKLEADAARKAAKDAETKKIKTEAAWLTSEGKEKGQARSVWEKNQADAAYDARQREIAESKAAKEAELAAQKESAEKAAREAAWLEGVKLAEQTAQAAERKAQFAEERADKIEEASTVLAKSLTESQTDKDKAGDWGSAAPTVAAASAKNSHTQGQRTRNGQELIAQANEDARKAEEEAQRAHEESEQARKNLAALRSRWENTTGATVGTIQDQQSAQKKLEKDVSEIAVTLADSIDGTVQNIYKKQTDEAKKQQIREFQNKIAQGDIVGAFGGNEELANKFTTAAAKMDSAGANAAMEEYFTASDVTVGANVEWHNNEATFNDVVIGVEAVLDDYSADEVAAALEYLTNEQREAVIEAMLNKYSLEEVMNSLKYTTDENRVAIIKAAIDKYGLEAVQKEFNKLTDTERKAIIKALVSQGDYKTAAALLNGLSKSEQKKILASLDAESKRQVLNELAALTAPGYKTIYTQTVDLGKSSGTTSRQGTLDTSGNGANRANDNNFYYTYPTGTKHHPGGLARVNDGTGAELIIDSHGAHVAAGGRDAIIDLEKGAKVYTHEQTRQMLSRIPSYAAASDDGGGGTGPDSTRVRQLVDELNAYFDSIDTGDKSYTQSSSGKSGGTNTSTGKISSSGGSGSGQSAEDKNWDELKSLIEYILKRLGKALDAQQELIDAQISELQQRKQQSDQQNKLEELQKNVQEAQSNLQEAESQRSVRYLGDDGQWHWMADQKKVEQAKEALSKSQESLQDYLNELVIDAQIKALEKEKQRLSDEYAGYTDLWSSILDAVDTPTGDLLALIKTITSTGTGAQQNGAAAVKDLLVKALKGGSYKKNYTEAVGEIAKATANNPEVPGKTDEMLAKLIASSGTTIKKGTMLSALQELAGGGTLAGGSSSQYTTTSQDTYYMINGVQIGSDMADLPMSEVLSRLSVMTNIAG